MKIKHKALVLSVCAVLLISASAMGTLAYLTDKEALTNTFTVGRVGLSLDEAKVDKMGTPDGTNRWKPSNGDPTQEYYLLPGHSYTKDPTVTVDAESEEAYVRMIVTVNFQNDLNDTALATKLDGIFTGYDSEKWERVAKTVGSDNKKITYEYRYRETVAGGTTGKKLEPLFAGFTVPGTYDNDQIAMLNGMTINVEAHAIQAAGFENIDKAWAAFDVQHNK